MYSHCSHSFPKRLLARLLPGLAVLIAAPALAADFDGSRPLLCATQQAMDVAGPRQVAAGLPDELGTPSFMRIDFQKKTITGTQRTTPIKVIEHDQGRLLLQGTELGLGWTLALGEENGKMSGSLVDEDGVIVVFGACTTLK